MSRINARFDHELSSNGLCGGGKVALLHGTCLFEEAVSLVIVLWDQLLPRWVFPKVRRLFISASTLILPPRPLALTDRGSQT